MSSYNIKTVNKAKSSPLKKSKSLTSIRAKSLPSNYKFKDNISAIPLVEKINTNIHNRLLYKLEKARKEIENDNDLYINSDHEKLCYYYKKLLEIKKKLITRNKEIIIEYISDNIDTKNKYKDYDVFMKKRKDKENKLDFKLETYKYNIKYNDYNKKFINKICDNIDENNLREFINKQNEFIENLNIREIYNLKYYTYIGDTLLNAHINNTFEPSLIEDGIVNSYSKICYFFYQFLDYFQVNNIYNSNTVPVDNDILFIEFIKNNYLNFNKNIYNYVFDSYLKELKALFNKAPKTENKLILYRGINYNYILNRSNRGYYITNQITSASLFVENAYKFTDKNIIVKIIVDEGLPLIFLEGITLNKGEFEIILPINSTLFINHASKKINYYKNKSNIICPDESNNNIINVTNIIYCDYK